MSKTTTIIAFAVGASVGAVASWLLTKSHYDKLVKEEIQSVKDMYKRKYVGIQNAQEDDDDTEEETEEEESERAAKLREYRERVTEFGYSGDHQEDTTNNDAPYVIPPEEFGENEDYDTETLNYYADGVLTDDMDNMIRDIDELVGEGSLNRFGEYEDDAVHVKNDKTKTYYEILKDERTFAEYMQTRRGR